MDRAGLECALRRSLARTTGLGLGIAPGVRLDPRAHRAFAPRLRLLRRLVREAGARVDPRPDGSLEVGIRGLRLRVRTGEEVYILGELHLAGVYSVRLPPGSVAIDIGCNAGFAALGFAAQPEVDRVVGFEPSPSTFQAALANALLNPRLARKLRLVNAALAAGDDRTLEVEVSRSYRGKNSLNGPPEFVRRLPDADLGRERFRVLNAAAALRGPLEDARARGAFVVAKIDCEGAEAEILEELRAAGLATLVDLYLIEWHAGGAARIADPMAALGYVALAPGSPTADRGMLYLGRGPCPVPGPQLPSSR